MRVSTASKRERDLALLEWCRAVGGIVGFLESLPGARLPPGASERWRTGMRAHYLKQVNRLLEDVPPGGQTAARDFRARIGKV